MPTLLVFCLLLSPSGQTAQDQETNAEEAERAQWEREREALSTEVGEEQGASLYDGLWRLLALPEAVGEALFMPAAFGITAVEKYRLDKRVVELLRNDAGTVVLVPKIDISGSDGLGLGATLSFKSIRIDQAKVKIGGTRHFNGDFDIRARYRHKIPVLDGRELAVEAEFERDKNLRYFGLGNETTESDRRVVGSRYSTFGTALEITPLGSTLITSLAHATFRQETLGVGESTSSESVGLVGDNVAPPGGFGEQIGYAEVGLEFAYDTRDTVGRPTRGVNNRFEIQWIRDVDGRQLSALKTEAEFQLFVPLLPRRRVLALTAGAGLASPIGDDSLPLHGFVRLGRDYHLRGYEKGRFRDRVGFWGAAEYRFPIFDYMSSGVELSPVLFAEAGRVGGSIPEVAEGPLRYSGGVGIRGAADVLLLFSFYLGFSPEGSAFTFSAGGVL